MKTNKMEFGVALSLLLMFVAVLVPEAALAAAPPPAAQTPGGIMAGEAKANVNASLFFIIILAIACFVISVVAVLKKEYGWAGGAFIGGIFSLGMTSCVNKMQGGAAMPSLVQLDLYQLLQQADPIVRVFV